MPASPAPVTPLPPTLSVRGWRSDHADFAFPELTPQRLAQTAPVGICISGGGTRSMCAGIGQLRGLRALGLLERTRYLSCVSGGSWLSTAFTFHPDGPAGDDALLGPVTAPEDVRWTDLTMALPPDFIGWTAGLELNPVLRDVANEQPPKDQVWVETVGRLYLEPWGLHDRQQAVGFVSDEAQLDDILAHNPELEREHFRVAGQGRPFLIVNGCVVGVPGLLPLEVLNPAPLEVTQMYAGSPYASEVLFRSRDRRWQSHWIGGGFVEAFAMGADRMVELDETEQRVVLDSPAHLYRLCDASGISSAFLAGFAEQVPVLGLSELNPSVIMKAADHDTHATKFSAGDGGVLENYGLLALLRRKVSRAVVFINTAVPLSLTYDPAAQAPVASDLDAYLPPFFGFDVPQTGVNTDANRVFSPTDFVKVVQALQAAKATGGPTIARTRLAVQANHFWGIEGGWEVDIAWVYLDSCPDFEGAIIDDRVLAELAKRTRKLKPSQGILRGFPQLSTSFNNGPDLVQLTPAQVRLLADQTCWSVMQSAELLAPMFALEED